LNAPSPTLVVFGGLPGTGKTTLARGLAQQLGATYVRIDTIEQALRNSGALAADVGEAGYRVAYALAADNLRLGRPVVADSVNPLKITRDAWRAVAADSDAKVIEIEVVCSDLVEHRRRVEFRQSDIPGLSLPSWQDVLDREYEPWDRPHIVVDTATIGVDEFLADLRTMLGADPIA
jgi:predicted kinase